MFSKKLRTDGLTEIASISIPVSKRNSSSVCMTVVYQSVMKVVWSNLKGIFLKAEVQDLIIGSRSRIGHVNNIPTMQLFTGIPRNTQSKCYMLSLTECVWEFRNNALWDTH